MPPQLTTYTLGQLTILVDGQPIADLSSRTAEALLIYLMCHKRPLSRQTLADFFWDDRPAPQAATNLRTVLSMLRKPLGDFLIITRQSVAFDHDSDHWLDVTELERRLDELEPLLRAGAILEPDTVEHLQASLDLYQGDFLEGFHVNESRGFEEWALLTQEHLRRRITAAMRRLVGHFLDHGEYEAGIRYAQRLLTLDPFHEGTRRQMMWLLARNSQRNAALQQYQACRELLAEELGVEPAPATTEVYQRIRALSVPPPSRLPSPAATFIGRDAELAKILHRFTGPDCRLLTILGPGGIGKTRLSIEVAHRLRRQRPGRFLDGIYFVPLAGVESEAHLPLAVADALGFSFQRQPSIHDQLQAHLRERELLLILDNMEHLLGDGTLDWLSRLIEQAPAVKIWVTSRERLALQEEWVLDVKGLPYPEDEESAPEEYDAYRLFASNAARQQATFAPSPAEARAVLRICRLLKGMPLGIELASSWIRHYDCAAIAEQIAESLNLTGSLRNLPDRHRSLRAVFEHSWRLLSEAEQRILLHLSIFQGGFDGAAAGAVAGATIENLVALVNKSLLYQDQADERRFGMHEMIRLFAAEKLAEQPEAYQEVQARHSRYFTTWLAGREAAIPDKQQTEARRVVHREIDNIRAAWRWAMNHGDHWVAGAALSAVCEFSAKEAWLQESQKPVQWSIERFTNSGLSEESPEQEQLLGRMVFGRGRLSTDLGDYDVVEESLQRSVEIFRRHGMFLEQGQALATLCLMALHRGQYDQIDERVKEVLSLAEMAGDKPTSAYCYNVLGGLAKREGDYERARTLYEQYLELRRELNDHPEVAVVLNTLGNLAHAQGEYCEARQLYEAAYETFSRFGYNLGMSATLTNAGVVACKLGEYEEARRLHQHSLAIRREMNDRRGIALVLTNLAEVALSSQAYEESKPLFREALELVRALGTVPLMGDILARVAELLAAEGERRIACDLVGILLEESTFSHKVKDRAGRLLEGVGETTSPRPAPGLERVMDEVLSWLAE